MDTWIQNYTAVGGSLYLTAAVALLPIIFFFVALTILKLKGYQAGLYTLLIALGVAILGFGMPAGMAVSSALYGFAYGLWPIAWIIVTAVFLYKITVKTGQFDIIRASVISITEDQRLQMLLVASPSAHSSKARQASARRWRLPPRCWWVWALIRSTPPVCV